MDLSKKSGLDDQLPAYQDTPGYTVAPVHDNTGFVGHSYMVQGPYAGQVPVIVQPPVFVSPAPVPQPFPDYLCYSIFTMLCCCLPLGVAALIYSIYDVSFDTIKMFQCFSFRALTCGLTREANMAGNSVQAKRNSRLAFLLNNVSLGIGIVIFVISIILFIVSVTMVRHHH